MDLSDANLLTAPEAAKLLNVTEPLVRRALECGQIPCITLGKRKLIPRKLFMDWLNLKPVLPDYVPPPTAEELAAFRLTRADAHDKHLEKLFAPA